MTLTTYVSHLNKLIIYVANSIIWLLKPLTTKELNFSNFFKLQLLEAVTRNNIKQKIYKKQSSKKMGDKAANRSSAPMTDCVATMVALYRDHRAAFDSLRILQPIRPCCHLSCLAGSFSLLSVGLHL